MATTPTGTPLNTPPTTTPPATRGGAPKNTWMPTAAGILSIIAGAADLLVGLVVSLVGSALSSLGGMVGGGVFGIPLIILGIVATIGGVFALQRKAWGMELAGAICALMWPFSLLGLLSIIFVAIAKPEFK